MLIWEQKKEEKLSVKFKLSTSRQRVLNARAFSCSSRSSSGERLFTIIKEGKRGRNGKAVFVNRV
jgi:hypothetical protein